MSLIHGPHGSVKSLAHPLFDDIIKMTVGYDGIFNRIDEVTQKYPPHDIIKLSDTDYKVNLAVAGFNKEDLLVTEKDNCLVITGDIIDQSQTGPDGEKHPNAAYIYKGISTRSFTKKISLGEGMEIKGATFKDGILSVDLVKNIPKPIEKTIKIQ